jgi:transcriptional regulator with XRE-family HTH domain
MDNGKIIELLKREKGAATWRVLATRMGISQGYLSDILNGNRNPGPKLLRPCVP